MLLIPKDCSVYGVDECVNSYFDYGIFCFCASLRSPQKYVHIGNIEMYNATLNTSLVQYGNDFLISNNHIFLSHASTVEYIKVILFTFL